MWYFIKYSISLQSRLYDVSFSSTWLCAYTWIFLAFCNLKGNYQSHHGHARFSFHNGIVNHEILYNGGCPSFKAFLVIVHRLNIYKHFHTARYWIGIHVYDCFFNNKVFNRWGHSSFRETSRPLFVLYAIVLPVPFTVKRHIIHFELCNTSFDINLTLKADSYVIRVWIIEEN